MLPITKPKHIIVVYNDGTAQVASYKKDILGPFSWLDISLLKKVVKKINKKSQSFLYGETQLQRDAKMIFYHQSEKGYVIEFELPKETVMVNEKGTLKKVSMPATRWKYHSKGELFVMKKTEKNLYLINGPNISDSRVCIGTAPLPTTNKFSEIVQQIHDMFYLGQFTNSFTLNYSKYEGNE